MPSAHDTWITRGTPVWRAANLALFLAGFSTFSLLYCVQPLLPEFAEHFQLSPAASSLALSVTTASLAAAIFIVGAVSQRFPRRSLMFASMALAATLNIIAAFVDEWNLLLAARLLEGIALGGVPAVAMAYLAEEIDPRNLSSAMGLYIAGTAFGGMAGRVGMGLLVDLGGWRTAMSVIGILGWLAAIGFFLLLPASRHFSPQRGLKLGHHLRAWHSHLSNTALRRLFAIGFILTGVFVAIFNYIGFRLSLPPYQLGAAQISLLFLAYAFGMFASSAGGRAAERYGRRLPLTAGITLMAGGVAITLAESLALITLGIILLTIGFFVAHAVASGWVGRLAADHKGHASSLYLLSYYLGSSLTGIAGGWFWEHGGWPAEVSLTIGLAIIGLLLAWRLPEQNEAPGNAKAAKSSRT